MSITINIPTRGGSGIVVALFPRGNWDSATDYAENDLVQHEGSSYYAINSSTNSEPPSGDWQLLAAAGSNGTNGADGSPGWTAPSALTYGSTVTPNLNTAKAFTLTATGNFTLANPTNQSNGATFVIRITQDATGSRTCTFGSAYKFAGGTPPLLSVAAGAVDTLSCIVWGSNDIEAWLSNNMKRNP